MRRGIQLALLGAVALGVIFGLHRIVEPDLFQQVAIGRSILADPASIGHPDFHHTPEVERYVADKWLASVAAATFDRAAGEAGLMLYQILLTTLVAASGWVLFRVGGASPPLALAGTALVLTACSFRLEPRPETLSLALMAVLVALLRSRARFGHLLWLVPLLLALWVNLHGYFVVGLLVLVAAVVAAALGDSDGPLAREATRGLAVRRGLSLLALALVACGTHPQGFRALAWPFRQLLILREHPYLRQAIQEFHSGLVLLHGAGAVHWLLLSGAVLAACLLGLHPAGRRDAVRAAAGLVFALPWLLFPPPGLQAWPYRLTVALLVAALIEVPPAMRERRWLGPLLLAGFTVLAAPMIRNLSLVPFAALWLLTPTWTRVLAPVVAPASGLRRPGRVRAGVLCAAVVVVVAWARLADRLPPGSDRTPAWTGWGVERAIFPAGAADFIERTGLPGPLLNHFDNGGYLLYRFHPRRRVFISGNTSLYSPEFFREFHRSVIGRNADPERIAARYGVRLAVLDHASPETSILTGKLMRSRAWIPVFLDRSAVVFARSSDPAIERLRIDPARRLPELLGGPQDRSPLPAWLFPRRHIYPSLNLGRFLRAAGRPDLALRVADHLWDAGPDVRLATFTAAAAEAAGDLPSAVPRLEWAAGRRRGGPAARAWLSRALYVRALRAFDREGPESARRDLERSLALSPAEAGPHLALARVEAASGNEQAARRMIAAALELSPDGKVREIAARDPLLRPFLPDR